MSQKQVVVSDDNTKMNITIGQYLGPVNVVNIDLTDSKSIVEGVIQVLSLSNACTNERINVLTQKIESLEKCVLSGDDIRRIIHLLRTQSEEFRADGRPTNDDLLASKLQAMLKT
jgi:hypothetical protein